MAIQEFIAPKSLSEAQSVIARGGDAACLAGGTDLLVGIRLGMRDPNRVIDLKHIPELTSTEQAPQSPVLQPILVPISSSSSRSTSAKICPGAAKNILGSPFMTACIGSLFSGVFMRVLPR